MPSPSRMVAALRQPESPVTQPFRTFLSALVLGFAILSVAGCASTDTTQAPGEYMDDSVITGKVKAAIFNEPDLKVLQISVETFRGDVQLSGFVDSQDAADQAVRVTETVAGVKSVRNDLQIR